jgi:hypothetical protein
MKTICQKSGLPIWKSDLLLGFDLADEHPIFKAKRSLILNKDTIFKFGKAENADEKRLWFLSVLNATYLVEFQYPAAPSLRTMEANFYRLMFLAQWTSFAEYKLAKIVSFPQYIIRKDNANLENIRSWLDAIDDIREKVNKKELERDKNAALLQREMEIKKELGEANFVGKAFTPKLAKWALELCDITFRHDDYSKWMKILCTPLNEAWIYNLEDLYEVQSLFQEGLPNLEGNPQAISVMFQVGQLIKECKRGFTEFSLIETDSETADFEIVEEERTGSITDESVTRKIHRINQHLKEVPTDEPRKEDFPNKVAFLIAKAKWELAQGKKNRELGENDV